MGGVGVVLVAAATSAPARKIWPPAAGHSAAAAATAAARFVRCPRVRVCAHYCFRARALWAPFGRPALETRSGQKWRPEISLKSKTAVDARRAARLRAGPRHVLTVCPTRAGALNGRENKLAIRLCHLRPAVWLAQAGAWPPLPSSHSIVWRSCSLACSPPLCGPVVIGAVGRAFGPRRRRRRRRRESSKTHDSEWQFT